jgi:hypothetical protein
VCVASSVVGTAVGEFSRSPPDLPPFERSGFPDAVALVTAYGTGEVDVTRALLDEAGFDTLCAFTMIVWGAIHMLAERGDRDPLGELGLLGRAAAGFASGKWREGS